MFGYEDTERDPAPSVTCGLDGKNDPAKLLNLDLTPAAHYRTSVGHCRSGRRTNDCKLCCRSLVLLLTDTVLVRLAIAFAMVLFVNRFFPNRYPISRPLAI